MTCFLKVSNVYKNSKFWFICRQFSGEQLNKIVLERKVPGRAVKLLNVQANSREID